MNSVFIMRSTGSAALLGPTSPFVVGWQHRKLILRLARREIEARYRGSALGLAWSVLVPLMMLAVYTFVFAVVFKARWDVQLENQADFAMLVFSGLILFSFFAECLNRAPGLMFENVSYIKKVVFPLEIMPWVTIAVALFNALVGFVVMTVFYLALRGLPPVSAVFFPLLLVPLVLISFGFTCFLSSMGVYLRDIRQFTGVLTTVLMFLSPIFYPISAVPQSLQSWIYLNPLTVLLESSKQLLFWGRLPDAQEATQISLYFLSAWLFAWLGYVWFMKTKKGFADVI